MPENEFGERIHNFFGQEGLSQGQHQSQVVDGSWPGFSNGLLVGSQRQLDSSLISNLKNYSAQQTVDSERGPSSSAQHGLNFAQQPIRSEFSRSQSQNHQQIVNGYMHGNQVFQTMQNETNFLGMDAESDGHRLTLKGVPPDLHKIPMRLEMGESPVNYDFFGGQQQINSQFPGMLQSFPRQQMGFNDMRLLQQQVMLKQMHEYQRQEQLQKQQLEARQLNSLNQVAVNGNRLSDSHSHSLITGVPLHDASNNSWQPELIAATTNWLHRGISPVVQGSSSGLMFTPEQGQMNLMGSVPQQFEQSLYGVPVSGTRGQQNAFSSIQTNKLAVQHVPSSNNSSLVNQHIAFSNQGDIQDSALLPRPTYQEKLLFSHASAEGSSNGLRFESLQSDNSHEKQISVQEKFSEKLEANGLSEKSHVKMTENVNSSQCAATLDPTEEKILFGSDDNLWDAFGNSTSMSLVGNNMSSGSDLLGAFPSLQSGSWSALMQSAVAETSSGDAGLQEWSGKQQSVWTDNTTGTRGNSHSGMISQNLGFKASNAQSERVHTTAAQTPVQYFQDKGSKVLDHSLSEKPMAERSQMAGSISHSSGSGFNGQNIPCSAQENEGIVGRLGIWKAASNSNSAGPTEHKNFFAHNLQTQRVSSGFVCAGAVNDSSIVRDVQGNIEQLLNSNPVNKALSQLTSRESNQIVAASDDAGKMAVETNEMGNSTKENSSDSFRSNLSPQTSAGGFRGSFLVNAHDSSSLPGGKQKQSGHIGRRPSIPRKFQYHPMGDIDVSEEPSREKVVHLQPMFQQVSGGNQGHLGHSKSLGQTARNMGIEKGHISQGDSNCTNEASRKGIYPDYSPSTSASIDRTVDRSNQVKTASSRQTMLELLHKVDQSQEHSMETSASGLPEMETSVGCGGQLQHNQSSASQGFNLQLAPPSQPVLSPDNVPFSRSSFQAVNSSNSLHTASEKGGMSQSRLASWTSNQSFLPRHTHQGAIPGIPGQTNGTSGFSYSKGYHENQQIASATGQSAPNLSVNSSSEMSASRIKERDGYGETAQGRQSPQIPSQLNPSIHDHRRGSAEGFPILEAMPASQPLVVFSTSEQGRSSVIVSGSRANISSVQHQLLNQPSKPHSDLLRSHLWSNSNLERAFSGQEKTNQISQNGGDGSSAGRNMTNMLELQGKDMAAKNPSDASSLFPKMVQGNLQTFGQSFTPNNLLKEKNSLQAELIPRNGEDDSTNGTLKRVKDPDGIIDPQQVAPIGEKQSSSGSDGLVRDGSLNHNTSANIMLPFSQNVSHSLSNKNLAASAGANHPQISPQMAPSWFGQYGSFKNGQVLPLNDVDRPTPSKIAEQSSIVGMSFDVSYSGQAVKQVNNVDPGQLVNVQQKSGTRPGAEALSSSESVPPAATDQILAVDRPKKRKTATSGLLSWSKEVMQVPERLQTLSEAEVEWGRATNRFAEKLEVEAELLEDISPVLRSKRRLILTTQLMQQLFRPPPARVMSLVASSSYETVAYTAARAALGDACSSSSTGSESVLPVSSANPLSSEKIKTAEKISDQYISKAVEDFISRAQRLESDFTRLEKGTTIPDLRVEVQDLEKFSVINRFAKFHARGQPDGTETASSSSSGDGIANSLRLYPQRYVTALPMPRNVPDRVQCLSL